METIKFLCQNFNRLDTSHVNSCIFLGTTVSHTHTHTHLFYVAEEWQPTILTCFS